MVSTLKINGVEIIGYVEKGGLKWQRNDIDGSNAGRAMDGTMERDRVAIKVRLDVTCRPLTSSEASTVLNLIKSETVTVTYYDPSDGVRTNVKMYSNNVPATFCLDYGDYILFTGIAFPLIEV